MTDYNREPGESNFIEMFYNNVDKEVYNIELERLDQELSRLEDEFQDMCIKGF
jgi:hypothetical protein